MYLASGCKWVGSTRDPTGWGLGSGSLRPKKPRANPASNRVRVRAAFSVLGSTRQPNDYDCRGWNWEIQKLNKIEKADKTRKIIGSGAKVLKEHLSLSKEALVDIHIWS
ncbi:hypothetical protein PSTT_14880 [Puccinia striiformis]|uniref:Uncharacterized protein n=1 Tax=Puccinia striiformis TaxID=27350 RepID=A0A2S4UKE2_9BASI|nr:hypothetical protein PSTT_14880 [Puccinia striiformis]